MEKQERESKLKLEARKENLGEVLEALDGLLEAVDCPMKVQMQLDIAVEEIFVNIASYAYAPEVGETWIEIKITEDPLCAHITFQDCGIPYDPLKKPDPDVTLAADERAIGGLGIFMVKKSMDDVQYKHENGRNILYLKKSL